MRAKHGDEFVEVRPQGRRGDGGNDGYLPADGHYYQVYGAIDPSEKISDAESKLKTDFAKLMASWNGTTPVKKYSFAFNDKYEGTYTSLAMALGDLESQHKGVVCRPFTAAHLEDVFMGLSLGAMQDVLGSVIPNPSRVSAIDYGVLREVIEHIMNSPSGRVTTRFGDLPTVNDKIVLNNLNGPWADIIRQGARQSGHVDAYFAKNSTFMKQALRDHIAECYRAACESYAQYSSLPTSVSRQDLVFEELRAAFLPPASTFAVEAAVAVLLGYYFETCDIFESRTNEARSSAPA
jgi:hypothetical protein